MSKCRLSAAREIIGLSNDVLKSHTKQTEETEIFFFLGSSGMHTHTPVRSHQDGSPLASLLTPVQSTSLKSSQRVNQKVTESCGAQELRSKPHGATRTARNPASNRRRSLKMENK